ncbi:hypothetical protein COW36_07910 [bacterium (Candidatus Blackallbacteria) CG17_big_fil_post_rev_8_21_14_2_50_48_46]|uniref:Uncharacterized protein n=1 Tax=bacterium (Candidatus Blackallbacteria) CG17_big_fil_post_rev_8_21_14_2_50_48_46 TaxID=2014261 RepID=A0A2M7G7H5_9BACT|nr:MAG: hypothetical protein COW64_23105 [bacterium (Candidatus Blackallbacteria) CG18_big_fil_WC_8_21_14_2_50_49_26]PIW17659.1 MAG: hypothetical protein COW36_07910 [bacterium (Candidatus Blackallbacteria) CG17_big_fil_post_rev_8_21_14_2_50_48_46]PIW50122.1 MAG: hypothetical protein COW20_03700 [bacterium (Candidatus Blackallbacteria) CG13_big_fil_rev_8_21_14_2_50_49_14]
MAPKPKLNQNIYFSFKFLTFPEKRLTLKVREIISKKAKHLNRQVKKKKYQNLEQSSYRLRSVFFLYIKVNTLLRDL